MTTEQILSADEDLVMWLKALVKLMQVLILPKKLNKTKKKKAFKVQCWDFGKDLLI